VAKQRGVIKQRVTCVGRAAQPSSVCPFFFLAHARAPIFAPGRAAYSPISMRYFLATNGSDSTYLDPVRPRELGALRCVYEYATIKRDLFISMTPEIDPSRALTVEMRDLRRIGKGLYLAKIEHPNFCLRFFSFCYKIKATKYLI